MIIGFLSGGFIGLVAGIFFMSMCQAASRAEELTKKFEDGYQGKILQKILHTKIIQSKILSRCY